MHMGDYRLVRENCHYQSDYQHERVHMVCVARLFMLSKTRLSHAELSHTVQ